MSARFFAASNAARSVAAAGAAGGGRLRLSALRVARVAVFAALDFFVGKLAAFGRATFLVRLSFDV